jgi:Raf kinase inhibitor-like YbhB/YbcL family protein
VIQSFGSPAFKEGQPIPVKYTGDGEDVSPELVWSGLPKGTKELALIVDDPDAPVSEPWVHWVIYNIPASVSGLPEGVPPTPTLAQPPGTLQGTNTWGTIGYRGPAPPKGHGKHHYHFKLYALDAPLSAGPGLDKKALLDAMSGHVLSHRELVGTYQR